LYLVSSRYVRVFNGNGESVHLLSGKHILIRYGRNKLHELPNGTNICCRFHFLYHYECHM
jgi:hypothetical protein